ncbi:MAG: hypothetical protein L0Z53_00625 [Acidobacteriales bacterium]|nr:hypothetical protein [Terriglobales bacterium]
MTKAHVLISGAWVIHATAWFLPVVKRGVSLPEGLPGWEAFRVASCAVWPCEGMNFDSWYGAVLSTISAVTTLLFVLGSPWVLLYGSRSLQRASAWLAATAFIINAHWYLIFGSDRSDLRIGYFLWWLSFMLLALGLFDLARLHRVTPKTVNEDNRGAMAKL